MQIIRTGKFMRRPVTVQAAGSVTVHASTDLTHGAAVAIAADFVSYRLETRPPVARSYLTVAVCARQIGVGWRAQRHLFVAIEAAVVLGLRRHTPNHDRHENCDDLKSGGCCYPKYVHGHLCLGSHKMVSNRRAAITARVLIS